MDRILCIVIRLICLFARFTKPLSRIGIGQYDEWKPGKKLKILLAGYNGARNTGSDARVAAIARQLKRIFGPDRIEITVMTLSREAVAGYFDSDVRLLTFSSIFPLDLYRACSAHHLAILCEGSTLKSTFANALTLFLCEAAGIMAAQKKPCIAYGSEVGYMEPFLKRAAVRFCRKTCFVTRTEDSSGALRELGLQGRTGTDTAWLYDGAIKAPQARALLAARGWDGKAPLLGVAVIDPFCWPVRSSLGRWVKSMVTGNYAGQYDKWYYFSDSAQRRRAYEHYIRELAKAVGRISAEKGFFPVIIGMERLDEKACLDLKSRLGIPCAVFLSGEHDAGEMTGILRTLSLLLTSRYHAAVLSIPHGCPITAVSMDERLDGIMKELSLDGQFLLHVSDPDLGRHALDAMSEAWANADALSEQIRAAYGTYRDRLDEMGSFLKQYLHAFYLKKNKKGPSADSPVRRHR